MQLPDHISWRDLVFAKTPDSIRRAPVFFYYAVDWSDDGEGQQGHGATWNDLGNGKSRSNSKAQSQSQQSSFADAMPFGGRVQIRAVHQVDVDAFPLLGYLMHAYLERSVYAINR